MVVVHSSVSASDIFYFVLSTWVNNRRQTVSSPESFQPHLFTQGENNQLYTSEVNAENLASMHTFSSGLPRHS